MKKYLFISNSNKPSLEEESSRKMVKLSNVSLPCIEAAQDLGYKLYMGVNRINPEELECFQEYDITFYNSSTYRSLFDFKSNLTAFRNLMTLLKREKMEVIHCNTPIGGFMGRLCGRLARVPKIIYTAHGFHFYKGAPLFNRTIIKWVEMWMAHHTDVLITMNQEDYNAAQKFKLRNNGKVYYVPGVGIDTKSFQEVIVDKEGLRKSLGLNMDDIVLIAMGDLVPRKNYSTSIKAIASAKNSKVHLLICGKGPELDSLKKLAISLGVEGNIHFLGYRSDTKELLYISDIFLFTTLQEGLPRSMMEAMASGLPCIASKIRGNIDLIEDEKGGYLKNSNDIDGLAEAINELASNHNLRTSMGRFNLVVVKRYDIENIKKNIENIYHEVLK